MNGLRKFLGFRLTDAEKNESAQSKFPDALKKVEGYIQALYADRINDAAPEMVSLLACREEGIRLAGQDDYVAANIELARAGNLKKDADAALKVQKEYLTRLNAVDALLADAKTVAGAAEQEVIRGFENDRNGAIGRAEKENYQGACADLKDVQEGLQRHLKALDPAQGDYIKGLKKIRADIKSLYAAGIDDAVPQMVSLLACRDEGIRLAGQPAYAQANTELARGDKKAAEAALKVQKDYFATLDAVRSLLADAKLGAGAADKEALDHFEEERSDAMGQAADANYRGALENMKGLKADLERHVKALDQPRRDYIAKLKQVRADIKSLYAEGIASNVPDMQRLQACCDTAISHAGHGNFSSANGELAWADERKKAAEAELKIQHAYEDNLREASASLKEARYILDGAHEVPILNGLDGDLKAAMGLAADANFAAARDGAAAVQQRLKELLKEVPKGRRRCIKKIDEAKACLKQLDALGLRDTENYAKLEKQVTTATRLAEGSNWDESLAQLKDATKFMEGPPVSTARTEALSKLAEGKFAPFGVAEGEEGFEEHWADAVMDLMNINPRLDKGDFHDVDVPIQISPTQFMCYKKLQEKMADKLPGESQRPTINLTVKGKRAPVSSFGIIGGTGPLSDAEMLEKTMHNLQHNGFDLETVNIRLLSAPPPRGAELLSMKMVDYTLRMEKFASEPHSKMALASNTAHKRIGVARKVRTLGGGGRMDEAGPDDETHQVQDLADRVVDSIKKEARAKGVEPRPFVMGTKEAYDANLYGKKFGEGVQTGNVDPKASIDLQKWIDRAKGGDASDPVKAAQLKGEIQAFIHAELVRQPETTHLVLSCTELPLALGGKDEIAAFEAQLQQEFPNFHFVDTESFFADQYTDMVVANVRAAPQ